MSIIVVNYKYGFYSQIHKNITLRADLKWYICIYSKSNCVENLTM